MNNQKQIAIKSSCDFKLPSFYPTSTVNKDIKIQPRKKIIRVKIN